MNSVFYFSSMIIALAGLVCYKKTDEKIECFSHVVPMLFLFMCYQAMIAWLLQLASLPISIISIGTVNWILGAFLCGICIWKKEIQQYTIIWFDLFVVILFAVIAYLCGIHQFGIKLDLFNYRSTIDSSRHLLFAREVAINHISTNISFMAVNTGLWFEALYNFMHPYMDYKLMMLTDIAMLFLSEVMFWSLIRRKLNDRYMKIAAVLLTILYALGYPLNNMVFGTSYLGAGVTCAILIGILITMIQRKEIDKRIGIGMLTVSLIGQLKAYPLFFPIILIAVIVFFAVEFVKEKECIKEQMQVRLLVVAGILCMIATCILFEVIPYGTGLDGLRAEGYMFRNLFGDFIFILPVIIYRFYYCYKKQKISFDFILGIFVAGYAVSLLFASYITRISTYYYYKIYYLFWMVAFYMMVEVICTIRKDRREAFNIFAFSIALVSIFSLSGLEKQLQNHSEKNGQLLNEEITGSQLFRLYNWNYTMAGTENMWINPSNMELFQKVAELTEGSEVQVPYIGLYQWHDFDYYAIAYQWEDHKYRYLEKQDFISAVQSECQYLCLLYSEQDQAPWDLKEYLSTLEVEFSNESGAIYRVQGK